MTMTHRPRSTISIDRTILEHPQAVHLHRIRAAIWLYLLLLDRLGEGSDSLEVNPSEVSQAMGVKEGTIRSWIGHLKKGRYIDARRTNGALVVKLRGTRVAIASESPKPPPRAFTVKQIVKSLGEGADPQAIQGVLADYPDAVIRKALAATLAVPAERIRRSRTALFLFLLKRYEEKD